jgi:hypothetical protein
MRSSFKLSIAALRSRADEKLTKVEGTMFSGSMISAPSWCRKTLTWLCNRLRAEAVRVTLRLPGFIRRESKGVPFSVFLSTSTR